MNKNLLIAIGITALFLGLAIQPSIATPQLKKIDVEPDINTAKELVAQLKVVINGILQDYGYIPIVRSLANTILDSLGLIGTILFCVFLILVFIPLFLLLFILMGIGMWPSFLIRWMTVILFTYNAYCPPSTPLLSLPSLVKPISSLTETNDITNLVDECPCIQE